MCSIENVTIREVKGSWKLRSTGHCSASRVVEAVMFVSAEA